MKYVLSFIIISLCLYVANVVATTPADKVKELVGKSGGEVVDEIDTNGISYRSFGMKNRRGDSAWCRIQYKSKSRISIETALSNGETQRRDIFEKNVAFEKIIDRALLGGKLATYNGVNMGDCRLCIKGVVELDVAVDSEEESSESFTPDRKVPSKEEQSKVIEESVQRSVVVAEPSDNIGENNQSFVISTERIIVCIVFVVLIVIIIILIFKKSNLEGNEGEMDNNDDYNLRVTIDSLNRQLKEKDDDINRLTELNRQLTARIESLTNGSVPAAPEIIGTPPPKEQIVVPPSLPPPVVISKFYFSNPMRNIFNASKKTNEFVDGKSLYCFERVEGESSAEVSVVNEPSVVQRFTYSPEAQMGVCEAVGGYNKNATNIETLETGSAVLDDDKWTVKKKIKIRYS